MNQSFEDFHMQEINRTMDLMVARTDRAKLPWPEADATHYVYIAMGHGLLGLNPIQDGIQNLLSPTVITPAGEHCVAAYKDGSWQRIIDEMQHRGEAITLRNVIGAVMDESPPPSTG